MWRARLVLEFECEGLGCVEPLIRLTGPAGGFGSWTRLRLGIAMGGRGIDRDHCGGR